MPYLGNTPSTSFATVVKDSFSGDGSTTAFTLSKVATTNSVSVFVENVRQEPTTAYAVSGTTLTFTAAPVTSSGNNIYVLHMNPTTTTTHPSAQNLTAVDGTFTGNIDVDGTANLDVVDIDGAVDMASSLTIGGAFTSTGIDDNADATTITIDSSEHVGIGTTSPAQQLHLDESASNSHATIRLEGNNRGGKIEMYQGSVIVSDIQGDQSGNLYFNTSGAFGNTSVSTKLTLGTAGDLTVNTGDLIFGTAGKGINLGVTSNTDSNTLDDYEEGTWTPSWNTGFSAIAYAQQYGRYVKIGSQVFAQFWILTHASNTVTTNGAHASMAGFPFTIGAASDSQDQFARGAGNVGFQNHNGNVPSPYGSNGETKIFFYYSGSTAWIHAASGNAHNSKYFIGGFTYTVDI